MHTYSTLTEDLEKSGLRHDDTVLIHSSMKSIGEVEGRADTVLDVLIDYFSKEGLLVFPTLSWNLGEDQPVFDVRSTPGIVGILPELFRQRNGVRRSLHPTHSVAAVGRDAEEFLAGHENFDTPCARTSPWGKLADRKAKILFIGTGNMNCNTFLHGVEEWFDVPGSLSEKRQQLYAVDYQGIRHSVPSRRHQGDHSRFYDKMRPLFQQAGILSHPRFGDAQCFLLDAAPAMKLVTEQLENDPQLFTHE